MAFVVDVGAHTIGVLSVVILSHDGPNVLPCMVKHDVSCHSPIDPYVIPTIVYGVLVPCVGLFYVIAPPRYIARQRWVWAIGRVCQLVRRRKRKQFEIMSQRATDR